MFLSSENDDYYTNQNSPFSDSLATIYVYLASLDLWRYAFYLQL